MNKKVRNATPIVVDDIHFRSKLEAYTYTKLKEAEISADYEGVSWVLLSEFQYQGEKIRPIKYTPDFVGIGKDANFVIECKGHQNDAFPLRAKLFKYYLSQYSPHVKYYIGKNQKEINQIIEQIKSDKDDRTEQINNKE